MQLILNRHCFIVLILLSNYFTALSQTTVTADFSKNSDPPLVKNKFNVYQTPLASLDRLVRDNEKLQDIQARSLRFENAWGKSIDFNAPSITGYPSALKYNRTDYTTYVQSVVSQNAHPLLTMGYTPNPLKSNGDEWRNKPSDMNVWKQINYDYSRYWSTLNIKPISYEVWNEPDLFIFFLGTKQDYFQIYKYGATGIKSGDADAKVGGPVTAFNQWYSEFLGFVEGEKLPLDFLSGHAYGSFSWQVDAMRNALNSPKWNSVEMYLTEYGSYPTDPPVDIRPNGKQEKYVAAADFFEDAQSLLEYTDLGKVYWAQWSDVTLKDSQGTWYLDDNTDKMGLLDFSGNPKALFNAFKIYNQMPVDRNEVSIVGTDLNGMASSDDHNAAIVVWNTSESVASNADITLNTLPTASGTVEVYRIDATHSSYYENHAKAELTVAETSSYSNNSFHWTGQIPAKGMVYLKLFDASGVSDLLPRKIATIVRTHHWFPNRSDGSFADFDHVTSTIRLGMGKSNDIALAQVGVVMENVPSLINVNAVAEGSLTDINENSMLAVRVDYQDLSGDYIHSVLYHGSLFHDNNTTLLPWGTKQKASKVIGVDNISSFSVNVQDEAPEGFRGRIIFTATFQNAAKGSRVKIELAKGSESIIPVQDLITAVKKKEVSEIKVYPNPFQQQIQIDCGVMPDVSFYLDDILGRKVLVTPQRNTDNVFEINTSRLSPGAYILTVKRRDEIISRQTMIKN